jgi:hypothetical protein
MMPGDQMAMPAYSEPAAPFLGMPGPDQAPALSPAQKFMADRAAKLAAEGEQRRLIAQQNLAQAKAQQQARFDGYAAEGQQRRAESEQNLAQARAQRQAQQDAMAQQQAALRAQPQIDNRVLHGGGLTQVPLAQRQAAIDQQQREVFGYERPGGAPQPQMPQRPPQMRRPPMAPQRAPQARGPQPRGPVNPQQQISFQPRQQQPQGGGGGIMQYAPMLAP